MTDWLSEKDAWPYHALLEVRAPPSLASFNVYGPDRGRRPRRRSAPELISPRLPTLEKRLQRIRIELISMGEQFEVSTQENLASFKRSMQIPVDAFFEIQLKILKHFEAE